MAPSTNKAVIDTRMITAREAAARLRLSVAAIYNLMDDGKLPYCRIPGRGTRCSRRIMVTALDKFVANSMVNGEI